MTPPRLDLSFSLTAADALAWESLPRTLAGWRLFVFYLWLGAAGLWLAVLPEHWIRGQLASLLLLLLFVALHWAGASLATTLAAHRRARRRIPAPLGARLIDTGAVLSWQIGAYPVQSIAPAAIRQVLLTPRHLFLDAPPALVIVPLAAFDSPAAAQEFAARWDGLSAEACP